MTTKRNPGRWAGVVCLLALGAILVSRLIWFDFAWNGRVPFERVTWGPLNLRDVPINILLFIPFGFGATGWLARRTAAHPKAPGLSRVVVLGLGLSAALEAAQLFLPDRVPSLADVLSNGIGTAIGYGVYRAWEMGFRHALNRYATRRNLLISLGLYVFGVVLLTTHLNYSVRLDNWDTTFPLVVGNEAVGKRQWSGRIERLELAAGLRDTPDFVARYEFTGEAPFTDSSGASAPALWWREGPNTPQLGVGVSIGQGEWLATDESYSSFTEVARHFNAFAIWALVSSADPTQRGPARIVSVSADAEQRNVTLGQEQDALIIRLRTPAGGENGQKPEVRVPGVFTDARPRDITVQYDPPMLRVWIDSETYALSLTPGLAFFPGFATENRWAVEMAGNPYRYDWAYWVLVTGVAVLIFGALLLGRWWGRGESQG